MLIKIDFESETAIYIQLRNEIIKGIAKGELQEGENLPSVRQLAGDIGINMHTVNKAYALLKEDGFINMDRRKGAVIGSMKNMITDEYKEKLNEEMDAIIAEVYCRGMSEEEFINMCREKFKLYK
ncbi:GntR family transcriptional regulator [Clostridium ganghwense]|uniref:GntR family transcriptional regulator n=1 Tax=Clostridium ganghwense TaxID=312089 RepID=A0ABT4CLX0_9CLOT|nr:GntR family transcriptional regulator [Clostridium ganghwense]MCY6370044.1 GntR family transcriptional regulator [Clostridium ganghwense]